MPADGIVVRANIDAFSAARKVMPVEQHRIMRREQAVNDVAFAGLAVIFIFRQRAAERGDTRAQNIHRMRGCGQGFQHRANRRWQLAQIFQLRLVIFQLRRRRQFPMHEQMCDLFKLTLHREIQNIVATIVQIVAAATNRAERGVACDHAAQRNGFLRLERHRWSIAAHGLGIPFEICFASIASNFFSHA